MKKILVITAYHTGHGHHSISDAVIACLRERDGVEVREIDGFTLLGRFNAWCAGRYGWTVQHLPRFWEFLYHFTDRFSGRMDAFTAARGSGRFRALLEDFRPDLILSVHSMFNGSVSRMLDKCGKKIPLITVQADIRTLHASWCNPRADLTVCPTEEAYRESIRQGMPEERLCMIPLPVRRQFAEAAREAPEREYDGTEPVKCLMMLGSEGSSKMNGYVRDLMGADNLQLTVICGNNEPLFRRLSRLKEAYPGRLEILGFTNEVARVMCRHDVLISRSSPNVLFEGITVNLPVIAIATLKGQEENNDRLVSDNRLGLRSADYPDLRSAVNALTENGGELYRQIREAQRAWRSPDSAQAVADCLLERLNHDQSFREGGECDAVRHADAD